MALPEAQVTHRALDGRRYLLSGSLDLSAPATSVVELDLGGRRHELTAGVADLGDDVVRVLGGSGHDQRLQFQNGTLTTVRTEPYDDRIRLRENRLTGVWRGNRYSLISHLYGATTTDLLGVLRGLRIREYDDGVAVHPHRPDDLVAPATLTKQVPGLGLLEISPLTREHTAQLPGWRGLATRAGELFSDELSDGSRYFVLAGEETWVTVLPLADTVPDRVPELADRLRLRAA